MSDLGLPMNHRGGQRSRRRRRRTSGVIAVLVALAVLVAAGGFAYMQARAWLEDTFAPPPDYSGPGQQPVLIEVQPGETSTDIAETLVAEDVVASTEAFLDEARIEERTSLIQAGFYQMRRKMSARAALDVLIDPANLVQNVVTVPEGLTVEETVRRLADQTELHVRALRRAAARPRRLGLPDYAEGELEGFLFPATYPLAPNASPRDVLSTMVDRFEQAARQHRLVRRAEELGVSPLEAVTIASIVEAEARRPEDFPRVARVIYNRLEVGMRLQMDSTVHYAVGKTRDVTTTAEDRRTRSPYNTYRHSGLPPGPIAAPGDRALTAALQPANGDWLYFVTVNLQTGETRFASTNEEHIRNVELYRDYCRGSDAC